LSKSPRQQLLTWPLQAVVNSCWDGRFRQVSGTLCTWTGAPHQKRGTGEASERGYLDCVAEAAQRGAREV
jgi:hypothetical protein